MPDVPIHLFLPLLASLLFVCGLLFVKRATTAGVSPWTVTFLANQWAALLFSTLWLLGGDSPPLEKLWQPAIIALLYILGQVFTFSAIRFGDVSVATPVFGIKVVMVAFLATILFREVLSGYVWMGAFMATVGIALVQWSPSRRADREASDMKQIRRRMLLTLVLAVLAALSFALFDVFVQTWAPAWGTGRFLPVVYWIVSLLSLIFLPALQRDLLAKPEIRRVLLPGTFLIGLQALCLVSTLATFGDAARVNVVYAMRAMWGVVLAWWVAKTWGGSEASLPREVMLARFLGAGLLTVSVILVVVCG